MISTFKFGYPFIYVGVAIWLFSSIDRWMLTFYTSLDEVGIYSVAFKFSSIILFVSTAFGMAWSPISIKLIKDYPNDYKEMYSVLLLVLMFVMVVLASIISIFSGDIVNLILNEEYKDSAMPLVFLCFGIAINTTGQITAAGISIEKKTYLFARVAWFAAIFNFVLNMIFIPIFGSTGAAFTTFLSHLFVTSAYLFYSQKIHYVPFQYSKICSFFIFVFLIIISSFLFHLVDDKYDVYILKISIILILILVSYKLIPKDKFKRLLRVNISND
jgi:O-antigen/teichoic acid export membrane protein